MKISRVFECKWHHIPAQWMWIAQGRSIGGRRSLGMGDTRAEAISDMRCQMDRCNNPKHKKRRPQGR